MKESAIALYAEFPGHSSISIWESVKRWFAKASRFFSSLIEVKKAGMS